MGNSSIFDRMRDSLTLAWQFYIRPSRRWANRKFDGYLTVPSLYESVQKTMLDSRMSYTSTDNCVAEASLPTVSFASMAMDVKSWRVSFEYAGSVNSSKIAPSFNDGDFHLLPLRNELS